MHANDSIIESHEAVAPRAACTARVRLNAIGIALLAVAGCFALAACAPQPLMPYSSDTPPLEIGRAHV